MVWQQQKNSRGGMQSRDQVKNSVRESADIVQVISEVVELKKSGTRFTGLCPFHAEKTPSFSVNPQGQFFHCFGCGESGDVFSFVMKYHRMGFPEALKTLAKRYNIDLPERQISDADRQRMRFNEQLYGVNEAAAQMYQQCLQQRSDAEDARRYLQERGVGAEAILQYRLGFAPAPESAGWGFLQQCLRKQQLPLEAIEKAGLAVRKDMGGHYDRFRSRIMFPILDMTGRVVAFGGRILGEGKPKYMNSPESPIFDKSRLLFGLYQHRDSIRKQRKALVVEGNFDLLLLAIHGVDNVVAPLGTSLTRQHIRSLRGYCDEVVLLFDADAAGLKAAMRSVPFFLAEQVEARVALLPEGHDPDSFVRQEGASGITGLIERSRPLAEFVYETLTRRYGTTLSGKSQIIGELQPMVQAAADPAQRSLMLAHFSEKLGVSPVQLRSATPAVKKTEPARQATVQGQGFEYLPRQEKQLADFLILYPEFLGDLEAAGVADVVHSPLVLRVIEVLRELSQQGAAAPERVMSMLTDETERSYVAKLLMEEGAGSVNQEDARTMCRELLDWLGRLRERQYGADLQEQINEAERTGNHELLMQLIIEKQEMGKKRGKT